MNNTPATISDSTKIKRLNNGETRPLGEWRADFPALRMAIDDAIASSSTQARIATDDGDAHFVFAVDE